jgi:acyl carrier protein
MDDIKQFIQNEIMSLAFTKVGYDDSLLKSKLLDSITLVDLLVSIEDKYTIKIPQHLINQEKMDTINLIVATIASL